ncbi:fumarylacetoacetate hydrolase family protein [Pendulispora brunnea]|uniref:Fumarylacetoacetate hydrolase family protein n=1 Tax=Pendulispora brunnea TaxID=2905690 RepID=A0ABZ2K471_9BACT
MTPVSSVKHIDRSDLTARAFTEARRRARSLPEFPGIVPADLATGYATQEAAIELWPDDIIGWKIGKVPPPFEERLGAPRICGPIFRRKLLVAEEAGGHAPIQFPVIEGGFAAVEAEFVVRVGRDAPAGKREWTLEEAETMVASMHIGMEPAGSPLKTINVLGPTVVVSDFGNNNGLILGPEIPDWHHRAWTDMPCETWIDGMRVGVGSAASISGGPIEALRYLLEHLATRNRPLRAGDLISTGAATGIHDVLAGQTALVRFGSYGEIPCVAVKARELPSFGEGWGGGQGNGVR